MKRSLKGALLSGLVFPGLGQLWLQRYLRGIAFMLAVCVSMAVVVMKAVREAVALLEKAEREGGAVDLVAIANSATHASATSADSWTSAAVIILLSSWALSVADAYVLGRKLDQADGDRHRAEKGEEFYNSKGGAGS